MRSGGLPRELALRIGLAARCLPEPGLPLLMGVLLDTLGLPLSAQKLQRLRFAELRTGADGALAQQSRAVLRQVLGHLRGHLQPTLVDEAAPAPVAYAAGDMPASVRVAVAAGADERLSGRFSHCAAFLVYQVAAGEMRLIDRRLPDPSLGKTVRDAARAALIEDCHLLYAIGVGNPVAALLMRKGIHPVQCAEGGLAREHLAKLQRVLANRPPPWLLRASGQQPVPLPMCAETPDVSSRVQPGA